LFHIRGKKIGKEHFVLPTFKYELNYNLQYLSQKNPVLDDFQLM
jgi:hypothetical protein